MTFSFFEPPLQNCNGSLKFENSIFYQNHIVRPIKWMGIAPGLTIYCQKMSQTIWQNSLCKIKLKIMNFSLFFKKRSRDNFLLDSSWFAYPWPTQKCKKTESNIILVSNPLSESSVLNGLASISFWSQIMSHSK